MTWDAYGVQAVGVYHARAMRARRIMIIIIKIRIIVIATVMIVMGRCFGELIVLFECRCLGSEF